ncbi:hypothetical protein Tco_0164043 [Tanacetum coccineum]
MEDTNNAHIPKVSTTTWFKPIPESERPATPEPEWTILPNDFPEPEHNWANAYVTSYKVPEENKLQGAREGPTFNLVKAFTITRLSQLAQMGRRAKRPAVRSIASLTGCLGERHSTST